MMAHRKTSSLLTLCTALALASPAHLTYAADSTTTIYTTEVADKVAQKDSVDAKGSAENSIVASGSLRQGTQPSHVPSAPLFCISLEPKGRATISQTYLSSVATTYYVHWTHSGSSVMVTFSPEDGKHPITFSRSGSKLVATGWTASEWGGKPSPSMHRDSADSQTAAASSGHHLSFHL